MPTSWRPLRLNPHLGAAVSALVDGQLDEGSTERAWEHVLHCPPCRRQVEREGWVKRQLTQMAGGSAAQGHDAPSDRLVGSLLDLGPVAQAWEDVEELEHRGRGRRRAGIALVGAGSVSAAVLGLGALGAAPLGIGGATGSGAPATSLGGAATSTPTPAVVAPAAEVHGRLRGWTLGTTDGGVAHARAVGDRRR